MFKGLFQSKNLDDFSTSMEPSGLKRALGAFDLTLLGVGAIVGAGIFTTIGTAVVGHAERLGAGPSMIVSFLISALVCSFTALCYAELASTVPISGSAYTYAYATLGEFVAWAIGWDLILEYAISNVAIAISWSNYFRVLLHHMGINVPLWLATDYRTAMGIEGLLAQAPHVWGVPIVFNALALLIVTLLTLVAIWGIRESIRVNTVMVLVKIAALLFFVGAACWLVPAQTMVQNWQPFFPNGWSGTLTGAAIAFFAFVGFDSVSTVTEETINPGRNVPLGIMASLAVCTVLYLAVTAVFTGMISFADLTHQSSIAQAEPLTMALEHVAPNANWASMIVAAGAVIAQTTALLVYQIAQPRIFFAMARDGLLPKVFTKVHPRYQTPHINIALTGLFIGVIAAVARLDEMVDLTSIGTLFAFVVVCIGVTILRLTKPQQERPFKVPFGPYVIPGLGAVSCVFLMWFLPPASWWRFVGWLVVGLVVYLLYGYHHSVLGQKIGRSKYLSWPYACLGSAAMLVAMGLFTLPHDAGILTLGHIVLHAELGTHARTVCGVGLIASGILLALLLWVWRQVLAPKANRP